MINEVMMRIGWGTVVVLGWFIGMCLYYVIKELASKLYWKAKVKTLHYKLYIRDVAMTIVPIHDDKFMISFKCDGYEDWFFYANAKSWKEIGAVASKNWSRYLAEREKAIELAEASDVNLDELFGDSMNSFVSDNLRSATDAMKAMADAAEAYAESCGSDGGRPVDRPGNETCTDGGGDDEKQHN